MSHPLTGSPYPLPRRLPMTEQHLPRRLCGCLPALVVATSPRRRWPGSAYRLVGGGFYQPKGGATCALLRALCNSRRRHPATPEGLAVKISGNERRHSAVAAISFATVAQIVEHVSVKLWWGLATIIVRPFVLRTRALLPQLRNKVAGANPAGGFQPNQGER